MDPAFQTNDMHEAEAHEYVYSDPVSSWVRKRAEDSGRFTTAATIEGEVNRALSLLHEFETLRRSNTPSDYFGMDAAK